MKLVALISAALAACHLPAPAESPDIPPPLAVVAPTSDDVAACAHLATLGCPEGWPRNDNTTCVDTFSQARTMGISVPSTCLIAATDAASVRKCGNVSTLTFECGQ